MGIHVPPKITPMYLRLEAVKKFWRHHPMRARELTVTTTNQKHSKVGEGSRRTFIIRTAVIHQLQQSTNTDTLTMHYNNIMSRNTNGDKNLAELIIKQIHIFHTSTKAYKFDDHLA